MINKTYKSEILGATVDLTEKRVFFLGGIFSQWCKCDIYIPELDVTVNCAEQAMMLHKAKMFHDDEMYNNILISKNPRDQKMYGRMVKNFDPDVYNSKILDIVSNINYYKFSQNFMWKELLILMYNYTFIEASPYDKIWGIGMGEDNPDIFDETKWQGTNWLGKSIKNAQIKILKENL